jgi:hypothetical protein
MRAACSKGKQLAKWTRCSCWRGAKLPGSNWSSLSRGKKALLTRGAGPVGSAQGHRLPSIALQRSSMLPSCLEGNRTGWAHGN